MIYEKIGPVLNARRPSAVSYEPAQRHLATFNKERLTPGLGDPPAAGDRERVWASLALEEAFVRSTVEAIKPLMQAVPTDADGFVAWFNALRDTGPGQNDYLFPWLAKSATYEDFRWFLQQEISGEAGFDDLVALTQLKMPAHPKLEMARNYWDEMGRGTAKGMHGPMLTQLADYFTIDAQSQTVVPETLALGNLMMALACNRRYGFHSVGALGVIELTAPSRAKFVSKALNRLSVPKKVSHYFSLHAVLDVKHSQDWNREVIGPLVKEDGRRAIAMAEGALMRLWSGARCFQRYRQEFSI